MKKTFQSFISIIYFKNKKFIKFLNFSLFNLKKKIIVKYFVFEIFSLLDFGRNHLQFLLKEKPEMFIFTNNKKKTLIRVDKFYEVHSN